MPDSHRSSQNSFQSDGTNCPTAKYKVGDLEVFFLWFDSRGKETTSHKREALRQWFVNHTWVAFRTTCPNVKRCWTNASGTLYLLAIFHLRPLDGIRNLLRKRRLCKTKCSYFATISPQTSTIFTFIIFVL